MVNMAAAVGASEHEHRYAELFQRARDSYKEKLWNGVYFDYDNGDAAHSDSCMSDQVSGNIFQQL
jgi:uncharacterized protein (DUF608 family)